MTTNQSLFSQEDLALAEQRIQQGSNRPINKALRFQAALKALIMDVSRLQRIGETKTVLAVDSVEIVSLVNYVRPHFSAFSFSGLLEGADPWNQALEKLDHMVSLWFFERREEPFLMPDSYFNELLDVRSAIDNRHIEGIESLFANPDLNNRKFEGFTVKNLEHIRQFVISQKTSEAAKKELLIFTDKFLPHWRVDLIDSLLENSARRGAIDSFLANSNYVHIRSSSFGARSLNRSIAGFDWSAFEKFLETNEIINEFDFVRGSVERLCGSVPKFGKTPAAISRAAENDGLALADIHVLNVFLERQGDDRRVELLTRSPLLHEVVRALPSGRLKVQLRHSLLLPEAFQFSEGAIASISDIAQRFDAVITPYLEEYETGRNGTEGVVRNPEVERQYLAHASEVARDLVGWLRDTSLIQVGKGISNEEFTNAYKRSITGTSKNVAAALDDGLINEIRLLFDLIIEHLERKDNPLTRVALRELIAKNRTLATVVWERAFVREAKIKTRVLIVDSDVVTPLPFVAVRMIDGHHTRLFHLYSKQARELVLGKLSLQSDQHGLRSSKGQPIEIQLSRAETLDQFSKLLGVLETDTGDRETSDSERAFANDLTLLVAMALASRGETTAAVSLASTVLHELTSLMRMNAPKLDGLSPELRLSYQELLLFRHFCERQIGVAEFRAQAKRATMTFLRGSVEKSFARAQRDLDFAATLGDMEDDDELPRLANDLRLRLVHMSGWIDMYLLTSGLDLLAVQGDAIRPLVRLTHRRDIWSALGFVKEAISDVERVEKLARRSVTDFETMRYLAHLEARLLQNALTMFLVLLFGKDVPMLNRMLNPALSVLPEHAFKFDKWRNWWVRFSELVLEYNFEFRLNCVFETVFGAIQDISVLRDDALLSSEKKQEEGLFITRSAATNLTTQRNLETGFRSLLLDHILAGLLRQSSP